MPSRVGQLQRVRVHEHRDHPELGPERAQPDAEHDVRHLLRHERGGERVRDRLKSLHPVGVVTGRLRELPLLAKLPPHRDVVRGHDRARGAVPDHLCRMELHDPRASARELDEELRPLHALASHRARARQIQRLTWLIRQPAMPCCLLADRLADEGEPSVERRGLPVGIRHAGVGALHQHEPRGRGLHHSVKKAPLGLRLVPGLSQPPDALGVVEGDGDLIGEGGDQLVVGAVRAERPLAIHGEDADQPSLADHRHADEPVPGLESQQVPQIAVDALGQRDRQPRRLGRVDAHRAHDPGQPVFLRQEQHARGGAREGGRPNDQPSLGPRRSPPRSRWRG